MKRHGYMISVDDRYGMLQEYEFIYHSTGLEFVSCRPKRWAMITKKVKVIARTLDV